MSWRRLIYTVLVYAIAPLVPLYLLWRARRQPEYAHGWFERYALSYGEAKRSKASRRVWLHAVSLGETRAAKPLVDAFLAQNPQAHIILSHTTPTGRAAGQALFAAFLNAGQMTQVYVPYDLPDVLARFLNRFAPTDCWLMETEIWPNSIAACVKRRIPVSLINGRLSDKTLQKTLKNGFFAQIFKTAYRQLRMVCAQSEADAARYAQLGVSPERLAVTGNLKFDMQVPQAQVEQGLRIKAMLTKPVVLLACTREGEEQMWLDALAGFDFSGVQWWVVPRHPQRFDEVEKLLNQQGFVEDALVRKTAVNFVDAVQNARVVLGDTMGEMFAYYAVADVVLMGGAWKPLGGQNFLEPMAVGKPVIAGRHTYNFDRIADDAVQAQALIKSLGFHDALECTKRLLVDVDMYQHHKENAKVFILQHQGVAQKLLLML